MCLVGFTVSRFACSWGSVWAGWWASGLLLRRVGLMGDVYAELSLWVCSEMFFGGLVGSA